MCVRVCMCEYKCMRLYACVFMCGYMHVALHVCTYVSAMYACLCLYVCINTMMCTLAKPSHVFSSITYKYNKNSWLFVSFS